jgi:tetratricopeptide (TPR) repeat protein
MAAILLLLFAFIIVVSNSYHLYSCQLSTDAWDIITTGQNELLHGEKVKANGHFMEAIDLTNKSIQFFFLNYKAYSTKATAYFYLGDYSKSLDLYSKSDPLGLSAEVAYNKGVVYSRMDNSIKAIECIDVYLNKYPRDIKALLDKGIAQRDIYDYSAANNSFDKIIGICNSTSLNNATAYYRYAEALHMSGNLSGAKEKVNMSLEMDKNYMPSLELQMRLLDQNRMICP